MMGIAFASPKLRSLRVVLALALALVQAGCAAVMGGRAGPPPPLKPATVFPEPAQLEALAQKPVTLHDAKPIVPVERWLLDGDALADESRTTPRPEQLVWIRLLEQAAALSNGRMRSSRALDCLAEQAGRFALKNGGLPDGRLQRFMAARCGAYAPVVNLFSTRVTVPADVAESGIFDQWRPELGKKLETLAEKAPLGSRAGIWFGRQGNTTLLVLGTAVVEVDLAPVIVDEQGSAEIRGVVTSEKPLAAVYAIVNLGERGFRKCAPVSSERLPRFAVRCALWPRDQQAFIDVIAMPRRRVLGHPVASVLAQRGDVTLEYVVHPHQANQVSTSQAFRRAILVELNRLRAGAGLGTLTLAPEQSDMNERLSASLFDAEFRSDGRVADQIALGLLAGWKVHGTIRDGAIVMDQLRSSHDAAAWLEQALENPFSRSILMNPDGRQIALGVSFDKPSPGLNVVATTYSFFDSSDHSKDVNTVLEVLRAQRAARGREAPRLLDNAAVLAEAARIHDERKHPEDALYDAMSKVVAQYGTNVRGVYFMGNALEFAELPQELLAPPELHVAVAVTHVKLPAAAWGQYVILVVFLDNERMSTA